jgi:protoheme IX farnesyltransferase
VKDARADAVPVSLDVTRTAPFEAIAGSRAPRLPKRANDYLALAKPRLNVLVVATSAAGYYLGATGAPELRPMAVAVAGTALVAAGAAVLNQVYERDTDALMRRTRLRPLPDGRVPPADASIFGAMLSAIGLAVLATGANVLAATLAVATLVIYLIVYTPMKRRSSMATLVGAVPGALPPLIGWTASHGSVSEGGAALFAIVFLWQIPHFMAIAWLYRDDYGKAGFPMLPVVEPDGRRTGRQAVIYAAALLPVSAVPYFIGLSGVIYLLIAAALGVALLVLSVGFARSRTNRSARLLFFASIAYLPLLWISMILDKT